MDDGVGVAEFHVVGGEGLPQGLQGVEIHAPVAGVVRPDTDGVLDVVGIVGTQPDEGGLVRIGGEDALVPFDDLFL